MMPAVIEAQPPPAPQIDGCAPCLTPRPMHALLMSFQSHSATSSCLSQEQIAWRTGLWLDHTLLPALMPPLQAQSNLLDAMRGMMHNEAVRVVQLEVENAALLRSLNILKSRLPVEGTPTGTNSARRNARSGQASMGGTPGASSLALPVLALSAAPSNSGLPSRLLTSSLVAAAADALELEQSDEDDEDGSGSDSDSACSVCTADEDTFALDECGPDGQGASGSKRPSGDGVSDTEGSGADDEDEEEGRQQAAVLTALEVVRQVRQ